MKSCRNVAAFQMGAGAIIEEGSPAALAKAGTLAERYLDA